MMSGLQVPVTIRGGVTNYIVLSGEITNNSDDFPLNIIEIGAECDLSENTEVYLNGSKWVRPYFNAPAYSYCMYGGSPPVVQIYYSNGIPTSAYYRQE